MGSNGSLGVQNYHELNRMAFKPRSPGSCLVLVYFLRKLSMENITLQTHMFSFYKSCETIVYYEVLKSRHLVT